MARVVFDLDGTLVDSARDIHAAVNAELERDGIAELDLPTITSFVGNGLPHLIKLVINATHQDMRVHEDLTARVLARYSDHATRASRPYPGVLKALEQLVEAGHTLGICTNKPEAPARTLLTDLSLGPFACIMGGDTLPQRKPDPAALHAALAALGEGPAVFVGDSEIDAETADKAGVRFLLFTEGYRKCAVSQIPHWAPFSTFEILPDLVSACVRTQSA